jgi:zinc protease
MIRVVLLLLLSLAVAHGETTSDPAPPALNPEVRQLRLPNGLTILVREDHRSPLVATSVLYRVGDGDSESQGRAHLVEHLMFTGSPNAPEDSFDALLSDIGATSHAWTSADWTVFQSLAPPAALELVLFLESDRMGWLWEALTQQALDRALEQLEIEHRTREATESARIRSEIRPLLWPPPHPYSAGPGRVRSGGEVPGLAAVQSFTRTWFSPMNAVVAIVGDVDAQATLDMATRIFGELDGFRAPPLRSYPDAVRRPREVRGQFSGSRAPVLVSAWNTVPEGHRDAVVLELLANILSAGRGTRLDEGLVHGSQRATGIRIHTDHRRQGGEFVVQIEAWPGSLDPVLQALDDEIRSLQQTPPTESELERATTRWRTQALRSQEDVEKVADQLAICMAIHDRTDCLERGLQRATEVTPGDIQAAARTYLDGDRVVLQVLPGEEGP